MGNSLEPGAEVAAVWRGENPGALRGRLSSLGETAVAVDFDEQPPWRPEQEVLLVAACGGSRCLARARFTTARGARAVFSLEHLFRPFDLRGQPRYPVLARAEVRPTVGPARHPAMVLDISSGGLAVEVPHRPSGSNVEVLMRCFGYSATLPCTIVGSTDYEARSVLHLRFAELSLTQQAFVRNVIAQIKQEMERYAA